MVASSTLFVVDQRQFAVVYSLGEIKEVTPEPGLKRWTARTRVRFSGARKEVAGHRLAGEVAHRRLAPVHPQQRHQPAQSERGAPEPDRAGRAEEEVTKRTVRAGWPPSARRSCWTCASASRKRPSNSASRSSTCGSSAWTSPPASPSRSTNRMKSERARVANELRSTGPPEGGEDQGRRRQAERDQPPGAYRDAQKTGGEGDAKASALYSEAFGRDPAFAQFYRSLDVISAASRARAT
ncbi:hypothetical protein Ddc_22074 [Ditylenchus destructor]|nr:hypothetical protein Ddc_22074 [Ditylenchus destructor]